MLQHVLYGGDCIVSSARGYRRLHEVLRTAPQRRMRAVADHGQEIHIVWLIVGQVSDWAKGRFSFFTADEQSDRAIAEKHRLNYKRRIQPLLIELREIELLLFPQFD